MAGYNGFLPRSLLTKLKGKKVPTFKAASCAKYSTGGCNTSDQNNETGEHHTEDKDTVKETSKQQRWPDGEEPVCVMCGKYGEYICDETDEDVCSLECKASNLANVGKNVLGANRGDLRVTDGETNQSQKSSKIESSHLEESSDQHWQSMGKTNVDFNVHYAGCLREITHKIDTNYSNEHCQFFRDKFNIKIKAPSAIPKLILDFKQCGFSKQLQMNLKENNYMSPTTVQMQVVPAALNGADVLVSAATSSGKTASFLLPIIHVIHHCLESLPSAHEFCKHPIALIMAPTRELCMQIEEQAKALCHLLPGMKTCLLVGGVPIPQQLYRLRHKIQIVIGTPGRINDVIDNHEGSLLLHQIKMLVLDEVDVMLQMGFQNQIERILVDVPLNRQNMMFSATIPPPIEKLAEKLMKNPVFVSVGASGVTNDSVNQIVMWVEEVSKRKKLFSIICEPKHFRPPVLVFVESKIGADILCEALQEKLRITCEAIHSDKDQSERTAILQNFLTGSYKVLISTNVMGRGIDLPNVRQVIIFDMPKTIEEYVHQVGRAGHLHSTGFSMAFINKGNKNLFLPLKQLCEKTGTKLPDELLHSPYLQTANERRAKANAEKEKQLKRKKWDDRELNQKSLLEILTKKRK